MPVLSGDNDAWSGFLGRLSREVAGEHAFVARNFLLDEGVTPQRVASYGNCMFDHGTVGAWQLAHGAYLAERVFRQSSTPGGLPLEVDPADDYSCPETFRYIDSESPFLVSDGRVHLIRLETLDFIARRAKVEIDRVRQLAEAVLSSKESEARDELDDVLARWAKDVEIRPVFTAFLEDVRDLFGARPEDDPPGWVDALRDRLGLCHHDPGEAGGPIEVLVFRYPVASVPALKHRRGLRPLVPPTVLDGNHSRAFCPAPRGGLTGHVVDLAGKTVRPHREVLHPTVAYGAEHVWRVGTIRKPVDFERLPDAREWHLRRVREISGRADYAETTDGDLLA